MSAFNILSSQIPCPNCKKSYHGHIQFKYGDTWQLHYQIGDKIKWGGNDIGEPGLSKVKVYGILDPSDCPFCREVDVLQEFDIYIENDVIVSLNQIRDIKDYYIGDGNFRTCDE